MSRKLLLDMVQLINVLAGLEPTAVSQSIQSCNAIISTHGQNMIWQMSESEPMGQGQRLHSIKATATTHGSSGIAARLNVLQLCEHHILIFVPSKFPLIISVGLPLLITLWLLLPTRPLNEFHSANTTRGCQSNDATG